MLSRLVKELLSGYQGEPNPSGHRSVNSSAVVLEYAARGWWDFLIIPAVAKKILMVEPDREIRDMLSESLKTQNYDVIGATSEGEALLRAKKDKPDLIVLVLCVSDLDGEKICRDLKRDKITQEIPLLVITASAKDDFQYLSYGADAVIADGPGPERLYGHCQKLLQRFDTPEVIHIGEMRIDGRSRTVQYSQREWSQFTPKEFDLLYYLADHVGKFVHQSKLYEKIWGITLPPGADDMLRTVDTHILRLRNTLKNELGVQGWIENKPKRGFRLVAH